MNKKYLGHSGGLIGPVTMDKPVRENYENEYPYYIDLFKYNYHLFSLPVLPCEGWKPELGKEYTKGVDFYLHDTTPAHITVAVPPPTAPEDILTPEEFCAYVQDAVSDIPKRHKTPPFAPAAVTDPWIPVTNPPERHVKVLVMDRIIRVFTGQLSLNGWLVNYSDGARYASTDNPVTHWQPLPQPPKQ